MQQRAKDMELVAQRFSTLLQIGARVHLDDGRQLVDSDTQLCSQCGCSRCEPSKLCEYGLMEAFRWQGRYIYYCPAGLTFLAACVARNGKLSGGITLGPFLLGEYCDAVDPEKGWTCQECIRKLPQLSTGQAEALGQLLLDSVQVEVIDSNVPNIYTPYAPEVCQVQQVDIAYKIKNYLQEHFNEKISLQDIALQVYLSRSYVSTLFKEQTGCGISEYLNALRVDHACRLLRETKRSLAEIAQECGFEDQSYFNRVFKKALCCSPIQYRKSPTPETKAQR